MKKLSLALATYNEESNIVDCIESCKGLVDEVVVVDGSSQDRTGELALEAGATVIRTQNESMFHINKQKAIEACTGDWILQLDADERVTPELAEEIKKIVGMTNEEIEKYQSSLKEKKLFERHQNLVQVSVIPAEAGIQSINLNSKKENFPLDSRVRGNDPGSRDDKYNAYFIPRLNLFLGGYLRSGGVYPDGVIRLIKKGKAYLPCKSIHELMEVEGKTGWLANPLIHKDSPTFARYLERNSRYIDRLVLELKNSHSCTFGKLSVNSGRNPVDNNNSKNENDSLDPGIRRDDTASNKILLFIDWVIIKPISTFCSLLIRHKGILDGWRGVLFAFFSAIRFPRAYLRYTMRG